MNDELPKEPQDRCLNRRILKALRSRNMAKALYYQAERHKRHKLYIPIFWRNWKLWWEAVGKFEQQ